MAEMKINDPLISVIVPVYNVEKYLERCVNSITGQTYSNLEIILVNDGSTDGSGRLCDILAEKDSRVKVIHKENGGMYSARNAGLNAALGAYIGFVDSDDWIEKDTYSYMLELILKYNADAADIECQYAFSDDDPVRERKENIRIYRNEDVLWNYFDRGLKLQNSAPYSVWRKLYSRRSLDNCLFPVANNSEDMYFNYEALKNVKAIVLSDAVKYHYFQSGRSISTGPLKKSDLALLDICKDIHEKEQNNTYKDINKLTETKLARSYFSILARIAKEGYKKEEFEDINALTKKLTKELRKNFWLLMRSSVPLNRKAFICIFCLNYKLAAYPYQILKRFKKS